MPFRIIATGVTRPVPDQIRIEYRLEDTAAPGVVIDTGSVTQTFPFDPALTPAQRRQRIRDTFRASVRGRVQGMRAADSDFAAIQTAVAAGGITVTEAD